MKFKVGDMVEIVRIGSMDAGLVGLARIGVRGIVLRVAEGSEMSIIDRGKTFYSVDYSTFRCLSDERCLRLVPPDPGRAVGEWDLVPWQPPVTVPA